MSQVPQANSRHLMLSRFRKGKRCVPGTYMSAAGIQTELSPNCLHKVAVHEAVYRKRVNIFRQDLEQQVDKLNKNQNVLKKSIHQYKIKKRENKRKRYDPPSPSCSDISQRDGPSKQMLIIVDETGNISKPMPMKRQNSRRENNSLKSPSLVSDSGIALDFESEIGRETATDISTDEIRNGTQSSKSEFDTDRLSKEFAGLSSISDLSKPVSVPLIQMDPDSKPKPSRRKGTVATPLKSPRKVVESQSLDNLQGNTSNTASERKTRKTKSAAPTAAVPVPTSLPHLDESDPNKEIVKNWSMAIPKKSNHRKGQSQTSAFMQLVRMKQNMSMSKNINMIDKLISGSKNKRLVYLRRISEVSDSGLSQLRSEKDSVKQITNEDCVDNLSRPPSRHVKLPPLTPEPETNADNPIEEKYKRAMRRVSIVALQPPSPVPNIVEETEPTKDISSPKVRTPRSQREVILRSEQMTSSRDINKFIQSEKEFVALHGKNVTWQESLAKLRDVNYLFPAKILEEKGFTV